MSIRYGESWPGRRPGTRRWISFPLSGPVLLLLPVAVLWWLGFWGIIGMIWLCAEACVLAVSALLVIIDLSRRMGHPRDITLQRLAWGLRAVVLR